MAKAKELTPEERIQQLETQLSESNAKNAELSATLVEQDSLIADMQSQVETVVAQKATAATVVEIGKTKYEVVVPKFNYKGETYTAADLQEDKKLAAELVKIGSAVLKEIV
jgi:uncharacterized coiled-coil protein SlyX